VGSRSTAVLFALAVVVLVPSLGLAQYTPQWHVGDWWVVKRWRDLRSSRGVVWGWDYRRYDVTGIEKVGQNDCYVLEIRGDRRPNIRRDGTAGRVLYVRADSWLVVRETEANWSRGKPRPPSVRNFPLGLFGPFVGEPRLPRFPLQLMSQDTAFKREKRDNCLADLREISCPADSALVKRLLAEGDTVGDRVVWPKGAVYAVRSELGGEHDPGSPSGRKYIRQSLQLWSDDLPWGAFEELVGYNGHYGARSVTERSWLIAVGRWGK
jgi:hypothetical protein